MSQHNMSNREHPSTYIVQDRSNTNEHSRVLLQDRLLTSSVGGPLSEQADPSQFRSVLDVGCGTGGWLIEMAKTYPEITKLIGVDISRTMVEFACAQAEAEHVADRVEFHTMDALRMHEFPKDSFDLVNQRLGVSWLRTWEWPKILNEYQRVSKQDGIIRITEASITSEGIISPAQVRFNREIMIEALFAAGYLFDKNGNGMIDHLVSMLERSGLRNTQTVAYNQAYRVGTPEWQLFYEDIRLLTKTLEPFFRKWIRLPDDYAELCQQVLREMQQPDFYVPWTLLTVWGRKGDISRV